MNIKRSKQSKTAGQAMLMSVIMMGGVLISASAIAGLLMVYQIRQAVDAASSAKAFFAADAGIEGSTFCIFKKSETSGCIDPFSEENPPLKDFQSPNVAFNVTVIRDPVSKTITVTSKANAGSAIRVLEAVFED